jgi:hypothetical protein
LGRLTAKRLTRGPDLVLKDSTGKPLTINAQTIAFSANGAWMAAETLGKAFVRINLATLSVTAFAPPYTALGGPSSFKSRLSITDDGRYVAISNEAFAQFKVYDLDTCNGVVNGLQLQNCLFHEYRPFISQQITGLQRIGHLRFVNDNLLSFDALAGSDSTGMYELAPAEQITSFMDYLALGDSYTSGEGAFDYLDGTDTAENMCHLSRRSYPLLLAHDLFSSAGARSVACSGAVIRDISSTEDTYRGQVSGVLNLGELKQSQPLLLEQIEANFLPGYIAQHRFAARWQPAIVTVSVGGNDIGFGNILAKCVAPHLSRQLSGNTCYSTYEDRLELIRLIDRTIPRWTALYTQLKHEAPDAKLYAIGYPQIAYDKGDCAVNVQLNQQELAFSAELIDYLNQAIRKAASGAGATYVDISRALFGYRLCEAASYATAMNGLTAGADAGFSGIKLLGKESYHPNAFGYSLIEQAILKQTDNFRVVRSETAAANPDSTGMLAHAPTSGRLVYELTPGSIADKAAVRGTSANVHAGGAGYGLRPTTSYTLYLDSPAGKALKTVMSSAEGDVATSATIPAGTTPGFHTIDLVGTGQDGSQIDITQPIFVRAGASDSDGDGIEDILDTCPGAENSGQDADHDGMDDICDNLIGSPPTNGSTRSALGNKSARPAGEDVTAVTSSAPISISPPARREVLSAHAESAAKNAVQSNRSKAPRAGRKPSVLILALIAGFWLIATLAIIKVCTKTRHFHLQ